MSPRSGRWRKAWGVSPRRRCATNSEPAKRAIAHQGAVSLKGLSPAFAGSNFLLHDPWGLRPRLYASVRFADSKQISDSLSMLLPLKRFPDLRLTRTPSSFIKRINSGLLPSPQFDYPALNHDCSRTQALLSTCFSLVWFRTV